MGTCMDDATKRDVRARLKRAVGQVEGVLRMIEDDRYCVDVLMQLAAARAALGKAGGVVLRAHVDTCVSTAFASDDPAEREAKAAELAKVFERYMAS